MRSDQEITIAELRNELSQVTADFEKAKLDSKQAEEGVYFFLNLNFYYLILIINNKSFDDADFCGRYQKKTSLMDNIFQLKQLECQLKLDLQQV